MRIATYNVENLFTRAKALNLDTWAEGHVVLDAYNEINTVLAKPVYDDADKKRILHLIKTLHLDGKDDGSPFVMLRQNRGNLIKRGRVFGIEVVAKGRSDWTGWVEMKTELVNETSTRNTAQVVRDVDPDVIAMCECEGRAALLQFSQKLLPAIGGAPYAECMLIDGNDTRGIDVGLMTKPGYQIGWMRSHVDDVTEAGGRIFSRDCPEYSIWTPSGQTIWLMVNHLKSQGYGNHAASDARRHQQAAQVRRIYERLKAETHAMIAVVGDLNDHPESRALAPLLADTDLKDASTHPKFINDGRPGTYKDGHAKDKIDYMLLSPALYERMSQGGTWRKGVWGGQNGQLWEIYPEMKDASSAGSDHACLWCDVEI